MNIGVSAEDAWEVIRDPEGVENYLPAISTSQVIHHQTGISRKISLMDGLQYEENIIEINDVKMEFRYTIPDPSPFNYSAFKGCIKVLPADDVSCEVFWCCRYEVEDELADEIAALLQLIITLGIKGIERRSKSLMTYA